MSIPCFCAARCRKLSESKQYNVVFVESHVDFGVLLEEVL